MTVQVIEARPQVICSHTDARPLKRVAAYCRVSTDSEEQLTSYEGQCKHYRKYIEGHESWELAGIFADEGISGTMAKKRPEFLRMIEECEAGNIDMIVTKSISRFARNTLDCLKYIRLLKDRNIGVFFEKENIDTLDAKGELLITIMASLAQQESQSISQNVHMGLNYGMQQGICRLTTSVFLGFTAGSKRGELLIVPEEADITRRIFREYLEGSSPQRIADGLTAEGIKTATGGEKWYASTIRSILTNEKYCGDVLLQKYYTPDFLTHRSVKNTGQLPKYYVKNHHEPIVPREVWELTQTEIMRRGALKNDPSRIRTGSRNGLAGRMVCGYCGRVLKAYNRADGTLVWKCRARAYNNKDDKIERGSRCGFNGANAGEVRSAIVSAMNELPDKIDMIANLKYRLCDDSPLRRNEHSSGLGNPSEAGNSSAEAEMMNKLKVAENTRRRLQAEFLLEFAIRLKERRARCSEQPGSESLSLSLSLNRDFLCPGVAGGACYEYEDFFRKTRPYMPDDLFDDRGMLCSFKDEIAIRYVECIKTTEDMFLIRFKAGIEIGVRRRSREDAMCCGY